MQFLRKCMVILLITLGIFVVIEMGFRFIAPQKKKTIFQNQGLSAGLENKGGLHRLRPNNFYRVKSPEYDVVYHINAEGFRDHQTYLDRAKPPETKRILLLGDSFTYGEGVPYEATWGRTLERYLNQGEEKVEIVKAGIPAYDTRTCYLLLKELAAQYQPDMVLLGFLPNDLFTNQSLSSETTKAASGALSQKQRSWSFRDLELHGVVFAERLLMNSDAFYCSLYVNTNRARFYVNPSSEQVRRKMDLTKDLFRLMADFCRREQMLFTVVSIPQQFQVLFAGMPEKDQGVDPAKVDRAFKVLSQELDFHWLDVFPAFSKKYKRDRQPLYFRHDGHLTTEGNRLLAELIGPPIQAILTNFNEQQP